MADDETKAAIDQAANALQTALVLATRVRQRIGEQADETAQLEAAVERAAKALKRVSPEEKQR
jgi:hypothetical protein